MFSACLTLEIKKKDDIVVEFFIFFSIHYSRTYGICVFCLFENEKNVTYNEVKFSFSNHIILEEERLK